MQQTIVYSINRLYLLLACLPLAVYAEDSSSGNIHLHSASNLNLPDMVIIEKAIIFPPSEIQRDGSFSLNKQSFTFIHQALSAREGIMLNLNISFSQNSIIPTADGRAVIARLARAIKFLGPSISYQIQGHSATLLKEQNNYDLALKRANQIVYILQTNEGVTNALSVISHGNKKPLKANSSAHEREFNSRITIVNLGSSTD